MENEKHYATAKQHLTTFVFEVLQIWHFSLKTFLVLVRHFLKQFIFVSSFQTFVNSYKN